jgi:hypothetical protein
MRISIDHPGYVDQLGRTAFARHVLDVIDRIDLREAGVVIGLEATWGAGKTRVLRSIPELLEERPDTSRPILINFNPWMVSGTHGLVEALLTQMSAGLASMSQHRKRAWWRMRDSDLSGGAAIARSLIEYATVLGTVKHFAAGANLLLPGSGFMLEAIGTASEAASAAVAPLSGQLGKLAKRPAQLSIHHAREQLNALLRALTQSVLVVVDDLDRLPPIELASMIQAIRAVADFPNVAYILAYDPKVAAKSLQHGLQLEDGDRFLEKIIQVRMPLPEIPARRIMTFAIERLKVVIQPDGLDQAEAEDLSNAWPLLAAMMRSPRDVERLRTRLLVVAPTLLGKVNMADVVLLEGISQMAPSVIDWIRTHLSPMVKVGSDGYDPTLRARGTFEDERQKRPQGPSGAARKEGEPSWRDAIAKDFPLVAPLRSVIAFLFDSAPKSGLVQRERRSLMRVQHFRFWYRWLCFHDHQDAWDVSEIIHFLREPSRLIEIGVHKNEGEFREFVEIVWSFGPENIREVDSLEFLRFIREGAGELRSAHMQDDLIAIPLEALQLCLSVDRKDRRLRALNEMAATCSLQLAGSVLLRAARELEERERNGVVSTRPLVDNRKELSDLAQPWLQRAMTSLSSLPSVTEGSDLSPYVLLSWMNWLGTSPSELAPIAERLLSGIVPLEVFFNNYLGKDGMVQASDLNYGVLPIDLIVEQAESSSTFQGTFPNLFEQLKTVRVLLRDRLKESGVNPEAPATGDRQV